mmetsp:Transcript_14363/g.35086  ORF Transcript_14363/g.35086 Transcript_14363/m.35086 type:complete len:215 (-) Transcript_14363:240-884(-)
MLLRRENGLSIPPEREGVVHGNQMLLQNRNYWVWRRIFKVVDVGLNAGDKDWGGTAVVCRCLFRRGPSRGCIGRGRTIVRRICVLPVAGGARSRVRSLLSVCRTELERDGDYRVLGPSQEVHHLRNSVVVDGLAIDLQQLVSYTNLPREVRARARVQLADLKVARSQLVESNPDSNTLSVSRHLARPRLPRQPDNAFCPPWPLLGPRTTDASRL